MGVRSSRSRTVVRDDSDVSLQHVQSADSEAASGSFHECREELSPRPAKGCCCCCGCAQRHWKALTVAVVLWVLAFVLGYILIPTYVVQSRLNGAQISLESAMLEIDSETSNFVKPRARVFAPQSLLYVPMLPFTAEMQPFESSVFVYVDGPPRPGDEHPPQVSVELGRFRVAQKLIIKSGSDVDILVQGDFTITGKQYLGPLVSRFISEKEVPATLSAKLSVWVKVWNWFPMYFSGVSVRYTSRVLGFDNFRSKQITLDKINAAAGQPSRLDVGCSAYVYNPSPMSLVVTDHVKMKVLYNWTGINVEVGMLSVPGFNIKPGMNTANGTLSIQQSPKNNRAIVEMITAYMGGVQTGFGPSATKPFLVSIADAGAATANSELVRTALKDLQVTVNFRPQPMFFLLDVTADIVIGGPIIEWPPSLYKAFLNVQVRNPLPAGARLDQAYVSAYYQNLSGPVLYHFNRDSRDLSNKYVIPPLGEAWFSFKLAITEVAVPTDFKELFNLASEAARAKMTLGVSAELHLIVDNGYQQQINYKNNAVSGLICYHLTTPSQICKGKATSVMAPALPDQHAQQSAAAQLTA